VDMTGKHLSYWLGRVRRQVWFMIKVKDG
jgi:hypothetical protein